MVLLGDVNIAPGTHCYNNIHSSVTRREEEPVWVKPDAPGRINTIQCTNIKAYETKHASSNSASRIIKNNI